MTLQFPILLRLRSEIYKSINNNLGFTDMSKYASENWILFFYLSQQSMELIVSNSGEIAESVLREHQASSWYGALIGRANVLHNSKSTYSQSDIVCEGMLLKRGTYFKSWKERYFILRRDIHVLCYYDHKDALSLLGTVPLSPTCVLFQIPSSDADWNEHTFSIVNQEKTNDPLKGFLISAHSYEEMVNWMSLLDREIKASSSKTQAQLDRNTSWWDHLFSGAKIVKSDSSTISLVLKTAVPRVTAVPSALLSDGAVGSKSTLPSIPNDQLTLANLQENEDDSDSDNEDGTQSKSNTARENYIPPVEDSFSQALTEKEKAQIIERRRIRFKQVKFDSVKAEPRDKKALSTPPYDPKIDAFISPSKEELCGLQINLRLQGVCYGNERVFVVLSYYDKKRVESSQKLPQHVKRLSSIHNAMKTLSLGAADSVSEAWVQLGQTETITLAEIPTIADIYLVSFQLLLADLPTDVDMVLFTVHQIDPAAKNDAALRLDVDESVCMGGGLILQPNIRDESRYLVPIVLSYLPPTRSSMASISESTFQMNEIVSGSSGPEVTVGVLRVGSSGLTKCRDSLRESFSSEPYVERVFSFQLLDGRTCSLEQIFVSKYAALVAYEVSSLFLSERQKYIEDTISQYEREFDKLVADMRVEDPSFTFSEDKDSPVAVALESINQSLVTLDSLTINVLSKLRLVRDHCQSVALTDTNICPNKVIPAQVGGRWLRRSVWKKPDSWQFCTMNLNLHILISAMFSSGEIKDKLTRKASDLKDLSVFPTITYGAFTAHRLRFKNGGLRNTFEKFSDDVDRLLWIHALQAPHTFETLKILFQLRPRERVLLFDDVLGEDLSAPSSSGVSNRSSISNSGTSVKSYNYTHENIARILLLKNQLAFRLDTCCSQALGYAVTTVRTVCLLAAQGHRQYKDILARSLKVGFLLCTESFLSSVNKEWNMIEDLEIAVLWLSLVSVRLVQMKRGGCSVKQNGQVIDEPQSPGAGGTQSMSNNDVRLRRDTVSGRLILDIYLPVEEARAVREAMAELVEFQYHGCTFTNYDLAQASAEENSVGVNSNDKLTMSRTNSGKNLSADSATFGRLFLAPLQQLQSPNVTYGADETAPDVLAMTELCGVLFSQGINAWQTWAHVTKSGKELTKQADINSASLTRLT